MTPLSAHAKSHPFFDGSDTSSSQGTPNLTLHSSYKDYEFPATPTKSVDNNGTPSALWRVQNLSKSPGVLEDGGSVGVLVEGKEHRRRSTTNGLLFQQQPDLMGGRFGEKFEDSQIMGTGEFSEVFEVVDRKTKVKYAVKRTRFAMSGLKER